ncbi:MAG: hypothetical protein ACRCX2_12705, partial [Paraclostridium sp.]
VYNATMITRPPKDKERIEFRLMNFFSTGQIYETKNLEGAGYKVGTVSEYRCQLVVRVFEDPMKCSLITGQIAGAIQTFEYLEQFADFLYVKNETMRITPFLIQKDNTIINFQEILVDCYIGVEYENDISYFNKIEDSVFDIK